MGDPTNGRHEHETAARGPFPTPGSYAGDEVFIIPLGLLGLLGLLGTLMLLFQP